MAVSAHIQLLCITYITGHETEPEFGSRMKMIPPLGKISEPMILSFEAVASAMLFHDIKHKSRYSLCKLALIQGDRVNSKRSPPVFEDFLLTAPR